MQKARQSWNKANVTHRGIGGTEFVPRQDIINDWNNDLSYEEFPVKKAKVSWHHQGFYANVTGTNLFIWLWKFHADHEHTTEENYDEPEVDGEHWTMTFTIFAAPEEDDEDEFKLGEDSEGEELKAENSIKITASVYEVVKNEEQENCPKKVFIHFTKTE